MEMMLEYLLIVLFMLHRVVYSDNYESCQFVLANLDPREDLHFDLNRLRGVQVIDMENGSPSRNTSNPLDRLTLMISLCDQLGNSPVCEATASACVLMDTGDSYQKNAGSNIVIKNGSSTYLTFDMVGSPCLRNIKKYFTLHFHIYCKESFEDLRENGIFAVWDGPDNCEASVDWIVEGQCGKKKEDLNCSVQIENNLVIDLSPLKTTYYSASEPHEKSMIEFNICGPIRCNGSEAFLCEYSTSSNRKPEVLGSKMYSYYSRPIGIVIGFTGPKKDLSQYEIQLVCVPEKPDYKPVIKYRRSPWRVRAITMETPIACKVPPPLCMVVDESTGHHYNLYPLSGYPLEIDHLSTKVLVSVCGPIHEKHDENIPCSGPGISICQHKDNKVIKVLGMLGSKPEMTRNSSIRIIYGYGDKCPYSQIGDRYKTYLELYCAKTPGGQEVEEIGCDIFIKYGTPAACASTDDFGKDCKVHDPRYNYTFDLNILRNEVNDITLPSSSSSSDAPNVRFNLCGPLLKPCNEMTNTSLCLYLNGSQIPIGQPASFPKYHDSMIRFDLYGPPCKPQRNYSKVTVALACDYAAIQTDLNLIKFVPAQACHFYLVWRTFAACPPLTENRKCNLQNEKSGEFYDLSDLSSDPTEKSYKVSIQTGNMSAEVDLFINVCGPVLYGPTAPCPPIYSGICIHNLYRKDSGAKFKERYNIGRGDTTGLYFDSDGQLKIEFRNGYVCENDKKLRYSSRITFICVERFKVSEPEHIPQKSSPCHFEFQWRTHHACPVYTKSDQVTTEKVKDNNCEAVNENTNQSFDLSSLKNNTWLIPALPAQDASIRQFYISICGGLSRKDSVYCGVNAGICMKEDDKLYMLGRFNENLHYAGRQLFLTYENGRVCGGKEWYQADISFICSNEYFPRNGPQYVGSVGCTHYFVFYTDQACEKDQQSCTVDTTIFGEEVHLSLMSLMQSTIPYVVESMDGHVFLLNVCGPLPRAKRMGCKDGSAACMLHSEARMTSEKPVSLGYPSSRPVLDHLPGVKRPQVVWKYTGGDPCPHTSKSNASASIRFMCDPNVGPGRPIFQSKNIATKECVYHFSWNTSVVCLEDKIEFNRQNCILTNHGTKETFNLTELYPDSIRKDMMKGLKPQLTGENLYIYLCPWPQNWMSKQWPDNWMNENKNIIECKDTAVCANVGDGTGNFLGYGYQHYAYYDSNNSTLKIFFRGTYRYTCSDRDVSGAEIWFPCAADRKFHKPKLLAATECHVVIEWPSPLFCPKGEEELSSLRTAWKTMATLMGLAVLGSIIIYVLKKTHCWPGVRTRVNRAMGYKHSSLVTYTVDPQEEWTEFETLNE